MIFDILYFNKAISVIDRRSFKYNLKSSIKNYLHKMYFIYNVLKPYIPFIKIRLIMSASK